MKIEDIVKGFNTTPFLFIGSGLSRRYLNLPDWEGLLKHFASDVSDDPFAYNAYVNRAEMAGSQTGLMPEVAQLIQEDYDAKWFANPSIRTGDRDLLEGVRKGLSPFKAEITAYIKDCTEVNPAYQAEMDALAKLSQKNIAGVITTNYDTFIEDHFSGYKTYVGQNELLFSSIQGIAEIYKIHGSVTEPGSIVINERDYGDFNDKSKYLAAKLLTIFMEYPIVFLGYSINDSNIRKIINAIAACLNPGQVGRLKDRFVFVEWDGDRTEPVVSTHSVNLENGMLEMWRITLSDFLPFYRALEGKQAKLPVRILRKFKTELYEFILDSRPVGNLMVAPLDDKRVSDDELVLSIGEAKYPPGIKGLTGLRASEWYRDIVLDDLTYTPDDLLKYSYGNLKKQNSGRIPVNKYLHEASGPFPEIEASVRGQKFDDFISNSIRKYRHALHEYASVEEIWNHEGHKLEKATRLMAHLTEEQIKTGELEGVLREIFAQRPDILESGQPNERTNIRRLIRIYDYLKWGK